MRTALAVIHALNNAFSSTDVPVFHSGESDYRLEANYPNPFNPATRISSALPDQSDVTSEVYHITGERVKTLVNGQMQAGIHSVVRDGCDHQMSQSGRGRLLLPVYGRSLQRHDPDGADKMNRFDSIPDLDCVDNPG